MMRGTILFLIAVLAAVPSPSFAAGTAKSGRVPSCGECAAQTKLLNEQLAIRKQQSDLLQKNRDYLASLTKDQVSSSIKVKSNILIFMVRIETLRNNIDSLREAVSSKTCRECERFKR